MSIKMRPLIFIYMFIDLVRKLNGVKARNSPIEIRILKGLYKQPETLKEAFKYAKKHL